MDREINIDSIRALEEQIREHERVSIKLRRTRNSLLNVSRLPPELLGNISHRIVTPEVTLTGWTMDHTTSSWFPVTGLKSLRALQRFRAFGVTP